MLANLATSILDKERVTTTVHKAKEVRGVVERLITYGKKGDLHHIRLAARTIRDKDVLKKLFDDIAGTYKDREGGYTRVLKLGERRGDNAELSIIELVGRNGDDQRKRKKKKIVKKTSAKPASQDETVSAAVVEETAADAKASTGEEVVASTEATEAPATDASDGDAGPASAKA
jgi:large subunit ribosomal protein L17